MAEAHLRVLAVHGDVVGEVGVDEDDVGLGPLEPFERRLEVLGVQFERLVHHDVPGAAPARRLGREILDRLGVLLAVGGLLPDDGDARGRRQPAPLLLLFGPAHERVCELLDGSLQAEQVLEAALVQRLARSGGRHVRNPELLGDRAALLHQRRPERAEHDVDALAGQILDGALVGGAVALVVHQDQLHRDVGAGDVHSALLVRELHRELVAVAQAAAALALGAGQRQRRSELDLFGWRGLNGRRDEERCDQGDAVHWAPRPESETLLSYGNALGQRQRSGSAWKCAPVFRAARSPRNPAPRPEERSAEAWRR